MLFQTRLTAISIFLLSSATKGLGFVPSKFCQRSPSVSNARKYHMAPDNSDTSEDWIDLSGNGAVKKMILKEGSGDVLEDGSPVEIDYVGTLAGNNWSASDVVDCWLSSQQGLDELAESFLENDLDGTKIMDETVFTEDFVTNELGVSNRIKCKKLIMAAKRLGKVQEEFPSGMEFDSNKERGEPFKFVLGKGKAIKGMDLAVASMKVGETSKIICRTDYAYGSEGYRKNNGDVVVPPFATLCFEVTLL